MKKLPMRLSASLCGYGDESVLPRRYGLRVALSGGLSRLSKFAVSSTSFERSIVICAKMLSLANAAIFSYLSPSYKDCLWLRGWRVHVLSNSCWSSASRQPNSCSSCCINRMQLSSDSWASRLCFALWISNANTSLSVRYSDSSGS